MKFTRRSLKAALGLATAVMASAQILPSNLMPTYLGGSRVTFAEQQSTENLAEALDSLSQHISGLRELTPQQIADVENVIAKASKSIAADSKVLSKAFDLVDLYETKIGPLFINTETKGGFARVAKSGLELHRAMFALQQGLIDHAFTPDQLAANGSQLSGKGFKTSSYFPGKATPPSEPNRVQETRINASQPEDWGMPVMFNDAPARRPTGCYLAPGSIATVTVPQSMVGKGFSVRVGAHSWDFSNKPQTKRLHRVSLLFPINSVKTKIANPLGGGIYIEVPYKADAGIVTVRMTNVIRSPFFSVRHFDKTKLEAWKTTERHQPGPWADFESDKFMMQVPSDWIRDLDDPDRLMRDWDASMDAASELMGLPLVRNKTILYMQTDVLYRGSANFPGYPMSNDPYNPDQLGKNPRTKHYMVRGPQFSKSATFHELGHATSMTKFKGETESAVNLPFVAVLNRKFGVDLDEAFAKSLDGNPGMTRDHAAITWMVSPNFRSGKPMESTEMMYQHRGHAKYVDIAAMFGWESLHRFWHSVQLDYERGINYPKNADPADSRILRMSKAAGVDLTPLIHFWGVHPEQPAKLKVQIAAAGLKSSQAIYDRLMHYRDLVPKDNESYLKHFKALYPRGRQPNDKFIEGYDEAFGNQARQTIQSILGRYFPGGRPK